MFNFAEGYHIHVRSTAERYPIHKLQSSYHVDPKSSLYRQIFSKDRLTRMRVTNMAGLDE
jgi:hypothetical protein